MADTKIAPRRLPFPVGTKVIFAQATVPPEWSLDTSDDDRLLRVVSASGGGVGGPDNANLNYVNLTHTHTLGGHVHNQSSHDHAYEHGHLSLSYTGGMATTATENSANYRLADNNDWYYRSEGHVLETNSSGGSTYLEGHHDHLLGNFAIETPYTLGSSLTNTAGPDRSSSSEINSTSSLNHRHSVDSDFRPRYFDIVVGELVG